jgi:hypothetical protein
MVSLVEDPARKNAVSITETTVVSTTSICEGAYASCGVLCLRWRSPHGGVVEKGFLSARLSWKLLVEEEEGTQQYR